MTGLFTDEQLTEMAARVRAKAAIPPPSSTPPPAPSAPGFVYRERPAYLWNRRAHQSRENFLLEPEPLKPTRAKAKALVENSPCTCGHPYGNHDRSHPSYPPLKETFAAGDRSVITTPCQVNTGCLCWNFISSETGKAAKLKRPAVLPHVLCKKCGHARDWHCKAHKATKIRKPGEWEGFTRNGRAAACQHTTMEFWYRCNSTSCATDDGKEFCPCEKFVNPWLRPKRRPIGKTPHKPRKKKVGFASRTLFPLARTEDGVV
jgi:hypothetical protein